MIQNARPSDLNGIMAILQKVGTATKDPNQGFLMNDYTTNIEAHRQKYSQALAQLKYSYVYREEQEIKGFLMAYSKQEWLTKEPEWAAETIWAPHFDRGLLDNYVVINQTAILPGLTGKGVGSQFYSVLFPKLIRDGYTHVFAETIIAPYPNFASLNFRVKHNYQLAGVRFEELNNINYTTLVYYKVLAGVEESQK